MRALQLAVACLLVALCVAPAMGVEGLISAADFITGKARAEADLTADRAACDPLAGNRRDICRERASGREKLARAELDLAHTGTRQARDRIAAVRLDVAYDIARTMCNDKERSDRSACAKQAQAARTQGEAALKARTGRAGNAAAEGPREANYRRDALKCADEAVEARGACLAAAKARAGKA